MWYYTFNIALNSPKYILKILHNLSQKLEEDGVLATFDSENIILILKSNSNKKGRCPCMGISLVF